MRFSKLRLPGIFTRAFFRRAAKPIVISFDGVTIGEARPHDFTTGSLGWYLQTKVQIKIGEACVYVQLGLNMTIIGSKNLPRETP